MIAYSNCQIGMKTKMTTGNTPICPLRPFPQHFRNAYITKKVAAFSQCLYQKVVMALTVPERFLS